VQLNKIILFSWISVMIALFIHVIFPKSLYGLMVFMLMELLGLIIIYLYKRLKKIPLKSITKSSIDVLKLSIPILWVFIYFLSVFTIQRYFNVFTWNRPFDNIPLMLLVATEAFTLTFVVIYLINLKISKPKTTKQDLSIWYKSISVFIMFGFLIALFMGPIIHAYHTDWIMNIHIIFTLFVAIPAFTVLLMVYLVDYLLDKSRFKSTH